MKNSLISLISVSVLLPTSVFSSSADHILRFDEPAKNWEEGGLPIGNGALGGVVFGGVDHAVIQFNVDSLWTGNENAKGKYNKTGKGDVFGAYQNFGNLVFDQTYREKSNSDGYHRQLDISKALHTTHWKSGGVTYTREAIASHPDQVLLWRISADKPGQIGGTVKFKGAHQGMEKVSAKSNVIQLRGQLPNKLQYEARARVIAKGGKTITDADGVKITGADEVLIILVADTNYVMDRAQGWMTGDPADKIAPRLKKASAKSWSEMLKAHQADYSALYDRVKLDLGKTETTLAAKPINERIQNYRSHAKNLPRPCLDPELEAMLFNYGRYLLISSSRQGTLPANLQGIWCNKNNPAWCSDFHTNINLQMNYWLSETTNLPELSKPLFDLLSAGVPVYQEHTKKEYGKDSKGFVTRMSLNPYGGGGWSWNIEGTAWLSQHFWENYQFSLDKGFLKKTAWPWMRDVSEFWLPRLKELPDGSLVVPNAWSHEHGPHEDGTAHAQQLMFDLFTSTLKAAEVLNTDPDLQKRLKTTLSKLYGPKVGSWGQLMEWMGEKDLEKSNHRHTSHLFGVHPGNQITAAQTPDLLKGAIVSLTKRGEVGDSRRSWTWAWRTALWSRMGDAERAHGCVAGLLAYNILDNLWTTHPPFQIDGNLGIPAGMAEMFVQSHAGEISLLPALPKVYPTGSVKGLRARGDVIVDITWKDGKLTSATLLSAHPHSVKVRVSGEKSTREIKLEAGKSVTISLTN